MVWGHKESAVCCQPIRQTGSKCYSQDDAVQGFDPFCQTNLCFLQFTVIGNKLLKSASQIGWACPWSPLAFFWWIASFLTFPPLPLFRLLVLDFVWHPCGETLCPQSVKAEQPVCGLTPGHGDTSDDGDELESTGLTTQEQKFSFNLCSKPLKLQLHSHCIL